MENLPTIDEQSIPCSSRTSPMEDNLQLQIDNYLKQITVLQDKIAYFENDYFTRTSNLNNQIQQYTLNESKLKQQLQDRENENNYLKQQLNEMENNIIYFKEEIKKLNTLHNQNQMKFQIETPNKQINDLVALLRQYSNEIVILQKENLSLKQELTNNINRTNLNESSYNQTNEQMFGEVISYLNNEFMLIVQWIDTYIGNNYDINYEVPSLFAEHYEAENHINSYFNLDSIKICLENARNKITNEFNVQNTHIYELKELLSQYKNKNTNLKYEIAELYQKFQQNKSNEYNILNNSENLQNQSDKISKLELSLTNNQSDFISFLENIYSLISNELNTILKDVNYKSFYDNIRSVDLDIMNDLNGKKVQYDVKNLQYLVSSAFDKLIRFLDELKYDYINCKEQNVRYLTDNLNRNGNLGEGMLFINDETNKMKKKVTEQEEVITRLESENNLLKCQIGLMNKIK